jgi:hypothetical protein
MRLKKHEVFTIFDIFCKISQKSAFLKKQEKNNFQIESSTKNILKTGFYARDACFDLDLCETIVPVEKFYANI